MPLPGNGPLSLQGHSRPGDTQQSKPKQAMIVRMSTETLEALQSFPNQPKMEFEFGENPGIFIGDTFFPMRPLREASPHELFLRTSTSAKPNAPLKLYANVTGKFTVERQLDERVQSQVRDRTRVAEKERTQRKAMLLDVVPPTQKKTTTVTKKRKEVAKKSAAIDANRTISSSSTALPSRVISPRPQTVQVRDFSARPRMIHCIALLPRATDEVMRLVGGQDCDAATRRELAALLDEIAERAPPTRNGADNVPSKWTLKTASWLEVRPYEWAGLSNQEQTRLARQARLALTQMKIPESDSAWDRVRYREPVNGYESSRDASRMNGAGASVAASDAKRGLMSTDLKSKKPRMSEPIPRKTADMVKAKDERVRSLKVDTLKAREKDLDEMSSGAGTPTSARPAIRRLPGSGYRQKAGSSTPSPPEQPPVMSRPSGRDARKDAPTTSASSKVAPAPPPAQERIPSSSGLPSAARLPKKPKDPLGTAALAREKEVDTSVPTSSALSIGFKRKKAPREEPESEYSEREGPSAVTVPKRRRVEEAQPSRVREGEREREHKRDLTLPRKPIMTEGSSLAPPQPRLKIKKEVSPVPQLPLPPPRTARSPLPPPRSSLPPHSPALSQKPLPQDRTVSSSSSSSRPSSRKENLATQQRANGSSKLRRKSPIYTSSEDEEESSIKAAPPPPQTRRERPREREEKELLRPPIPTKKLVRRPRPAGLNLPEDSDGLRRLYKQRYAPYLALYQRHVNAVAMIEKMLEGDEGTDSDADMDVPSQEELVALKNDLRAAEDELEMIRVKHESLRRLGRASGSISSVE